MNKKKLITGIALAVMLMGIVGGYSVLHINKNQEFLEKYTVSDDYSIAPDKHSSGRMETEELSFGVFKARYNTYMGNLAINDNSTGEYLIIWENIFNGENDFGVAILSEENKGLYLDFDENGVGETAQEHKMLCEYAERVNKYLGMAKDEWGIDVEINTAPYDECK